MMSLKSLFTLSKRRYHITFDTWRCVENFRAPLRKTFTDVGGLKPLAGGDCIVVFTEDISKSSYWDIKDQYGSLSTIGFFHRPTAGTYKAQLLMTTVAHNVEDHINHGWPIYSWYGETAFIGSNADELERVNVFRPLPMQVVEHDSVNDVAVLKVESEDNLSVVCDFVQLLGRINVSPDQIGDCVLAKNNKLIGNGFLSGPKALHVVDYDNSSGYWAVTSPSLQPFQKGDSGVGIFKVNEDVGAVGDNTPVDAVCLLSKGDSPTTVDGEDFGPGIDIIQKCMKYPQPSQVSMKQASQVSIKKESGLLEVAPIRGVPIEKLPQNTRIIPPWSVKDVPLDDRVLRVKGFVPIDKLPNDTHIVIPSLTT